MDLSGIFGWHAMHARQAGIYANETREKGTLSRCYCGQYTHGSRILHRLWVTPLAGGIWQDLKGVKLLFEFNAHHLPTWV